MKRTLLFAVLATAVVWGFASSAAAQSSGSSGAGGGASLGECLCSSNQGSPGDDMDAVADQCHASTLCSVLAAKNKGCFTDANCAVGEMCLENGGCCAGDPVNHPPAGQGYCVPVCDSCLLAAGEGVCNNFPICDNSVPTLSQWGLIGFAMLLLTAMFLTIRHRGVGSARFTASLLVLLSAGVIAAAASYAHIQANRQCGDSDVAVEFIQNLLES